MEYLIVFVIISALSLYAIVSALALPEGKAAFTNLRTLSCKSEVEKDILYQQMGVFYYQLGNWLNSNDWKSPFGTNRTTPICNQLYMWVLAHRRALDNYYPGLATQLFKLLSQDLISECGSHMDPFGDAQKHFDKFRNEARVAFLRKMQQKYNVHPEARH